MKPYKRLLLILTVTIVASTLLFIGSTTAQNGRSARTKPTPTRPSAKPTAAQTEQQKKVAATLKALRAQDKSETLAPTWSEAVAFVETPALRDLPAPTIRRTKNRRVLAALEQREKNESNTKAIRPIFEPSSAPFEDPTLKAQPFSRSIMPNVVTNPLANFDGPDMDTASVLFGGGRFAPPDTNAAAGPNHVVIATNGGFQVFNKAGVSVQPVRRMSDILVGIPNATDDDGDPIVLYDWMADRWMLMQFNIRFTNTQMHMHFAVSKTPDPTGQYYAYDFLTTAGRFSDYPHVGVWPDGYYMSTNDFNQAGTAFLGAGMYALERAKMLVGDPTAKIIGFNTGPTNGGMLPTNHQGYTPPPAGVPNLFFEWDADEFGAATDLVRTFALVPNYANPPASTLTPGPNIPTVAFDARNPGGRSDVDQLGTADGLDSIADRFMHALNFRVLPGGVQSYVGNFTVNVSGVAPTTKALYQAGVRWMEFRRDSGTGAISINQQATYAPGAGNGATGRDLWMASVAQDGEGNIGLGASASSSTINPTAIYTGRLAGDPLNTLPQGEIDALAAVIKGSQTGTGNRWGDYSSLFADPSDDCTFWGAFEYVDGPLSSFDWNTRVFSFKVNPQCVTPQKGTLQFNVTNCETGLPIENASITLDGNPYGATLANGQFSTVISPGTYNFSVTKTNFSVATGSATVTNGNTTIVNVCLQGVPVLSPNGATLIQESCPPTNAAVDPGETVTVRLNLTNTGGASTSNLVATLQPSANVLAPSGPHNYGVIAPGGSAGRDFSFTANGNCGDTITLTLSLQDGANNLGTANFTMVLGALGAPVTANYSTGNIAVPILDVATVEVPINVPDTGSVTDINVRVRLNHTFDGDLQLRLVHPDGSTVLLSNNRGGSGDNFGTGTNDCSGTHTVFDDSAATAISAGIAPFAGTFRPETPLNALNGKASNGVWKLRISDTAALDIGTVGCVQLEITRQPFVCNTVCAGAPRITTSIALSCNGSQVRATYTVANSGTATANNVMLTTAKIGAVNGAPLPQNLGNLAPGGSGVVIVDFTGAPSGLQTVIGGGTHAGGTFSVSRRMNVPNCAAVAPTIGAVMFRWLPPALTESTISLY